MTFDADARSIQDARPAELYTIVTPTTTYRLTSYSVDVSFGGNTYTAATIGRDNIQVPAIGDTERQLQIKIALSHALAQDLLVGGIPLSTITAEVDILMQRAAALEMYFLGTVAQVSTDGNEVTLLVSGKIDQKMATALPNAVSQRVCQHGLYDTGCAITPTSFQVSTTIATISSDGRTLTVASMGANPDQWAQYGKITRSADGESRSVITQTGTSLLIDTPFRTLVVGDAVVVNAGCDHTITTCRDKFNNRVNYGGNPLLPTKNILVPLRIGVLGRAN